MNTAKLVDKSQLVNLDEIAKIAKEQNLTIHISGAADSATGTNERNHALSIERAKNIGHQLMSRGVPKENLKATSLGGISQFTPKEANRFGVVLVHSPTPHILTHIPATPVSLSAEDNDAGVFFLCFF